MDNLFWKESYAPKPAVYKVFLTAEFLYLFGLARGSESSLSYIGYNVLVLLEWLFSYYEYERF